MKSTVFGYRAKTTCVVSLILVDIILFIHNGGKEAKTHSVSKMELVVKERLCYRVCPHLLQLLHFEPIWL